MIDSRNYVDKSIGNYRIVALIGSGGFGSVYQGEHSVLKDRIVAIKILHNFLSSTEERSRFLQEAQLLEHIRHPQILQIFDAGIDNGLPYLVTEYATHGSLRDLLKRYAHAPLPVEMSLTILSQVGEALGYAHQQQIVHRDLKPENILFNAHNTALLADFGIASTLTTSSIKYSSVIGTPSYMAPEQFQGTISKEGDQYALGCIAYELFTGQVPFAAPDFFAMGFKHLTDKPIDPTQLNPALPEHIEQAILKAMAKQRGDRYTDVRAFILALRGSEDPESLPSTNSFPTFSSPQQYNTADKTAFAFSPGISDASTFVRVNDIDLDRQNYQDTYQSTLMASNSAEERQWGETRQSLPSNVNMWKEERPYPSQKHNSRKGIVLAIACAVAILIILSSLFFVILPNLASSRIITRTVYIHSTGTSVRPTSTAQAKSHPVQPTVSTSTSSTPFTSFTPTHIATATSTHAVTPTPTPTHPATPTPTPTPPTETFRVYFNSANSSGSGVSTQYSYSGTVSISISGYGQASSTQYSDAFYIFTDAPGTPTPPHTATCWVLYINGQTADSSVGLPSYNSSHIYNVSMTLSQPATINFGICDNQPTDNSGYLTITVQEQTA